MVTYRKPTYRGYPRFGWTILIPIVSFAGVLLAGETMISKIYWIDWTQGDEGWGSVIQRADPDGTHREDVLVTGKDLPYSLAFDMSNHKMYRTATYYDYFNHPMTANIIRANLDGSQEEDVIAFDTYHPYGIALDRTNDLIYWTDYYADKIFRACLDGSGICELVRDLYGPTGIALDITGGKIYWAEFDNGKLQRANLDGSDQEVILSNLPGPEDIILDIPSHTLYWSDSSLGKIQRVGFEGVYPENVIVNGGAPTGIALDRTGAKIYWNDGEGGCIRRANLDGSEQELLALVSVDEPHSLLLDIPHGKIYWADFTQQKIQRANLDGSEQEDVISDIRYPVGIALDQDSKTLYWTNYYKKIQRASLLARQVEEVLMMEEFLPVDLVLDSMGKKIYWTAFSSDDETGQVRAAKIQKANWDGSQIEDIITTGLTEPHGLALDPVRDWIYWADNEWTDDGPVNSRIQRASLDGLHVERISIEQMVLPMDIAIHVTEGRLYWTDADSWNPRIQRAELDGSNVEDIVTIRSGLVYPNSLSLDPVGGKVYWTDAEDWYWYPRIQRANLDGTEFEDLITEGLGNPSSIAYVAESMDSPVLDLLNPNGGETLLARTLYTIGWEGQTDANDILIEYSVDDGVVWTLVDPPNAGNSGSYEWKIPDIDSVLCRIRISDASDPEVFDVSDAPFTIYLCTLKYDLNQDCVVDLLDFALLASEWMQCGNPYDSR